MGEGYTEPGRSCDREEPRVILDVHRNKKILSKVALVYSMNFNSNFNHIVAKVLTDEGNAQIAKPGE